MIDFFIEFKLIFYFDFLSNIFLLIVSIIRSCAFFYSSIYIFNDYYKNKFVFLTLFFVLSIYIVILRLNFLTVLIGWDCLGIISYLLVIYYHSDVSDYCGIVTILINRIGDVGIIFGIFFIFLVNDINFYILKGWDYCIYLFRYILLLGGLTKRAQYPFFRWLPLAIAAPTPISALVHSSTLVTAGVYLFIRFDFLYKFYSSFNTILSLLVGVTIIIASLGALSELDIKKIIAYSTLSQLSLIIIVVILGNDVYSFFHILRHALFKALIFLCSGIIIHSCFENQDIRCYFYVLKFNLFIVCLFFICSISLSGLPYLRGFYSKDLILEFIYNLNYNKFYVAILILNTLFSGLYSLRVVFYSIMMSKKNIKLIFFIYWDKINNSLFYLFFFMLISGSFIFWLILLKFDIFYFNYWVKILNIVLVVVFILIFNYVYSSSLDIHSFKFIIVISYILLIIKNLTNFQSLLVKNFFKLSFLYRTYLEKFNELLVYKNVYFFLIVLNNLIRTLKIIKFYFLILFFITIILLILFL